MNDDQKTSAFPATSPPISIVIAAYRGGELLRCAIDSARKQTHENFELLVIDDANRGATRALVEGYADTRFRYLANEERLGVAKNHWRGLRESKGQFVAILNEDDLWEATFLEEMFAGIQSMPEMAVAFCDHYLVDQSGNRLSELSDFCTKLSGRDTLSEGVHQPFQDLVVRGAVSIAQSALWRRSEVDPIQLIDQVGPAYDLWLAYQLAKSGRAAYYTRRRLSSWRKHAEAVSASGDMRWPLGALYCWELMQHDRAFANFEHPIRLKRSAYHYEVANLALHNGSRRAAITHAIQAILATPFWPRPWLLVGLSCIPRLMQRWIFQLRNKS